VYFRLTMSAFTVMSVLAIAACGGSDDGSEPTAEAAPCSPAEEVPVEEFGDHLSKTLTVDDYETNPPAGGDHNGTPLDVGTFYEEVDVGMAVHALEHGGVIGWTNNLSKDETTELEKTFNDIFGSGYESVLTVELPDLEGPFALSAWGTIQNCDEFDASVIKPFVDEYYGTKQSAEGYLACLNAATELPACKGSK